MKNKLSVSESEARILFNILKLPIDIEVLIFGSRLNNTHHEFSDLDICLKGESVIDLNLIGALREKFEQSNLPFTVDIVDYNRVDLEFQKIINSTGINLTELS